MWNSNQSNTNKNWSQVNKPIITQCWQQVNKQTIQSSANHIWGQVNKQNIQSNNNQGWGYQVKNQNINQGWGQVNKKNINQGWGQASTQNINQGWGQVNKQNIDQGWGQVSKQNINQGWRQVNKQNINKGCEQMNKQNINQGWGQVNKQNIKSDFNYVNEQNITPYQQQYNQQKIYSMNNKNKQQNEKNMQINQSKNIYPQFKIPNNQQITDQVAQYYIDKAKQSDLKVQSKVSNLNLSNININGNNNNFQPIKQSQIKILPIFNNSNMNNNNNLFNQFKVYNIVSAMNVRFVLDASQSFHDKNKAIIFQNNKGSNQKFILKQVNINKYVIFCAKNGFSLQIDNKFNQQRVIFRQSLGGMQNQICQFVPVKQSAYHSKKAFNLKIMGKYVDVSGAQCKNQAKILIYQYNGNKNQLWYIQQTE